MTEKGGFHRRFKMKKLGSKNSTRKGASPYGYNYSEEQINHYKQRFLSILTKKKPKPTSYRTLSLEARIPMGMPFYRWLKELEKEKKIVVKERAQVNGKGQWKTSIYLND